MRRVRAMAVLLLAADVCPACWIGDKRLGEDARLVALNATAGTIQGLDDAEAARLRRIRDKLLADVDLEKLVATAARAATEGVKQGADDRALRGWGKAVVEGMLAAEREQGGEALSELLEKSGPAVQQALVRSVAAVLAQAGRSARTDLPPAAHALTAAVADAVLEALAESARRMTNDLPATIDALGPTMHRAAAEIAQGGAEGLRQGFTRDVAQEYGHQVGIGLATGVREVWFDPRTVSRLEATLIAVVAVLGIVLLACLAALWLLQQQHERATTSLAIVAGQVKQLEHTSPPMAAAMKQSIQKSAQAGGVEEWLHGFLKKTGL